MSDYTAFRLRAAIAILLASTLSCATVASSAPTPSAASKPEKRLVVAGGFLRTPTEPGEYFRAHGYRVSEIEQYPVDLCDVRAYARHIADEVERAYWKSGGQRVVIFAFSLGGLASLYAVKRLGISDKVSALITVGAPFHGSNLALFALPTGVCTPMALQVMPGSPFTKALNDDPLPAGPTYVSIAGSSDTVCPPETAHLPGASNLLLRRDHGDFFDDETALQLAESYL